MSGEYEVIKPMTASEIGQYMERIGYEGSWEPVKETLDELIYRHQCSVPFETVDTHDFGMAVDLSPDVIFDKIVTRHRGGYCLELNGAFYRLLVSLGFETRPCLCRVLWGSDEFTHPIDHRANLVTLDGKTYYCDVGAGGPLPPGGLDIEETDWQQVRGEFFRIEPHDIGWKAIRRRTRGSSDVYNETSAADRIEMLFTTIRCYATDLEFLNYDMYTHPEALHKQHRILNRRTAEGFCAIWDDEFKELRAGRVVKEKIDGNLYQILDEKFGIVL